MILIAGKNPDLKEDFIQTYDPIDVMFLKSHSIDTLISFGYRHILKPDVLDYLDWAINLHISYLPWNRGADPNLWSWIDDTPKGVTIHHIDEGIDTGDIICQRRIFFDIKKHTLKTTYNILQEEIVKLFKEFWSLNNESRTPQKGEGSFHLSREKIPIVLEKGWDTPVEFLRRRNVRK